jgi:hypothetical protein
MKLRNKKTGEIVETDFELSVSVPDDEKLYGNDTYTQINGYSSIKDLIEDWEDFEEPKEKYNYYYLDCDGGIYCYCDTLEDTKDYREIGNYFETKEEAEKAVEKLKAWKRLKDKGFRFTGVTTLFDGDWYKITFNKDQDETWIEDNKADLDLLFGGEE